MECESFSPKVGMKVVPHDKTIYGSLDNSSVWNRAKRNNYPHLYIVEIRGDVLLLNDEPKNTNGDLFHMTDVKPYIGYEKSELRVGMKVKPFKERFNTTPWQRAQKCDQPFLYIKSLVCQDLPNYVLLTDNMVKGFSEAHRLDQFVIVNDEPTPTAGEKLMSEQPKTITPFSFNPHVYQAYQDLPIVFAYSEHDDLWCEAYFLGYDGDNERFNIIWRDEHDHAQAQYISITSDPDPASEDAVLRFGRRSGECIAYIDGKWQIALKFEGGRGIKEYITLSHAWASSVKA